MQQLLNLQHFGAVLSRKKRKLLQDYTIPGMISSPTILRIKVYEFVFLEDFISKQNFSDSIAMKTTNALWDFYNAHFHWFKLFKLLLILIGHIMVRRFWRFMLRSRAWRKIHDVTLQKAVFLAFSNLQVKMQFDVAKYGSKGFSPGT